MLVILEVAQDTRLDGNVEIIGLIRSHRHEVGTHNKAVHLAAHRAVHVSNLVSIKIIASRDADIPVLSGPDITIEA